MLQEDSPHTAAQGLETAQDVKTKRVCRWVFLRADPESLPESCDSGRVTGTSEVGSVTHRPLSPLALLVSLLSSDLCSSMVFKAKL